MRRPVVWKYRRQVSISFSTPTERFTGMILDRVSSSGAWRDTDNVNCNPRWASLSILSVSPQVDREMCRMPMFSPSGWLTRVRNFITVSKLSSGSPMPMRTMLETGSPLSSWVNSTWAIISAGVRSRTLPARVEAQKAQPMRQPTWQEMHTVFPCL